MELNPKLNLVVPIYDLDGNRVVAHVHVTPINRTTFDKFYFLLAKTFSAIYSEGLGTMAGPRVAAKLLMTVAESLNAAEGVKSGLLAEIRRLTMFLEPGQPPLMLEDAIRAGKISDEDVEEVENAAAFFTVVSLILPKIDRRKELDLFSKLWGASTSSLDSTAFSASLSTSIAPASTGGTGTPSFIPH